MLPALQLPATATVAGLRAEIRNWRDMGYSVGFVPTMGALHAGHVSLVLKAMEVCDRVVASIYVNPAQFAPGEDFDSYPRTLERDAAVLAAAGCHLLYAPTASEMYPDGFATRIEVGGAGLDLESVARPHFFGGVATVVAKLLNQVRPDVAVFGEKDYQQLLVIRQIARDLDLNVRILGGETAREADGLAMSSRNAYLSEADRIRAGRLNIILRDLAEAIADGEPIRMALEHARTRAAESFDQVDYIELRHADTLVRINTDILDGPGRVLAAVRVGGTRLIDNMAANRR